MPGSSSRQRGEGTRANAPPQPFARSRRRMELEAQCPFAMDVGCAPRENQREQPKQRLGGMTVRSYRPAPTQNLRNGAQATAWPGGRSTTALLRGRCSRPFRRELVRIDRSRAWAEPAGAGPRQVGDRSPDRNRKRGHMCARICHLRPSFGEGADGVLGAHGAAGSRRGGCQIFKPPWPAPPRPRYP